MPYIIVSSIIEQCPRKVSVSGLKGQDIEQLAEFRSISQIDEFTVLFREHVCVMLSALEVLGYQVVTSSSTLGPDPAHITHIWTMRRALADPDLISADDSP
ncbi:uncharacterized protein [Bemisia tabaci]|uniref:uncharacterized protein isoform X6 n=1 Tax=Bemisia tabaci TaxID=7038 RepID=UPI0008F98B73|nr:PREDICTED: uncharacterized protein LOC109043215 isoform X4 [Bemisia tabaci]